MSSKKAAETLASKKAAVEPKVEAAVETKVDAGTFIQNGDVDEFLCDRDGLSKADLFNMCPQLGGVDGQKHFMTISDFKNLDKFVFQETGHKLGLYDDGPAIELETAKAVKVTKVVSAAPTVVDDGAFVKITDVKGFLGQGFGVSEDVLCDACPVLAGEQFGDDLMPINELETMKQVLWTQTGHEGPYDPLYGAASSTDMPMYILEDMTDMGTTVSYAAAPLPDDPFAVVAAELYSIFDDMMPANGFTVDQLTLAIKEHTGLEDFQIQESLDKIIDGNGMINQGPLDDFITEYVAML